MIREIRLHGRGGQGVVMAAQMLVASFVSEGKYACGFPMFGSERRGAPVNAFVRFTDEPVRIRSKTQIYSPDTLLVLDSSLLNLPHIFEGLKPEGILVANCPSLLSKKPHQNLRMASVVDATRIALEEIGMPITNICMLGAFAKTTGWLVLESVLSALEELLTGELLEKNRRSAERGFKEVKLIEW